MLDKFRDDVVDVAIHGRIDVAAAIMNSVVGDAVLWEVVGADFFAAVASADEGFASFRGVFHFLFLFLFKKAGAEDIHGFDAVLLLTALVLHSDDDASRQMGDPDGGVGGIDSLTAVTAGAVNINAEVFLLDLEVFLGSFGKDSYSSGRSVNTALRLPTELYP